MARKRRPVRGSTERCYTAGMTSRKACVLIGAGSLLLGAAVLAVLMLAPLNGVVLAILVMSCLVLLGLSMLAFSAALHTKPAQMLGDNVAVALLDVILSSL